MIFHGSLLIDLANASWTTLKFFRQRIAKKDFLTVGQNNLLAESDRFTFGARIHNRCDLHAARSVVRLYPNRANWLILLCSIAQVVTFPLSSFTSKKMAICGLRHRTSFTVPFNERSVFAYVAPLP